MIKDTIYIVKRTRDMDMNGTYTQLVMAFTDEVKAEKFKADCEKNEKHKDSFYDWVFWEIEEVNLTK